MYGWFDIFVMIRQATVSQLRYCGPYLTVSHCLFPVIIAREQKGLDEPSLHCDVRQCNLHLYLVPEALQTKPVSVNLKRSTFCFIFCVGLRASHDNTFTVQYPGM